MFYLKLVGALIMSVSFLHLGYSLSAEEERKQKYLDNLLGLLKFIRAQIDFFLMPAEEILRRYDGEFLVQEGFIHDLRTCGWQQTLAREKYAAVIDEDVREMMRAFGAMLGSGYKEEQIASCDYYIERLETALRQREEETPRRKKLYRTLSLLACAMVVILIL